VTIKTEGEPLDNWAMVSVYILANGLLKLTVVVEPVEGDLSILPQPMDALGSIPRYCPYYRPIARPGVFWLNRDS
jgi:hypothetical protein